ncbi:MAG: DUF4173 domain-containing protein [Armatimonadetes bacterium]|nr:DUF4173 domain-containing protein [Armatimonadota bacterium]
MERKDRALFAGGAALVMGVTGAALFKDAGAGLNVFLWLLSVGFVMAFAWNKGVVGVRRHALALLAVALAFSFFLVWRDSAHLRIANWLVVGSLVSVAALRAVRGSAWSASAWEFTGGIVSRVGRTIAYPVILMSEMPWAKFREGPRAKRRAAVLRGTVLAVPPLLLFGALFSRADAMFEKTVVNAFQIDANSVVTTVFLFIVFAFVGAALVYPHIVGDKIDAEAVERPPKVGMKIGMTEVCVVLGSLFVMFALFVGIQFRYLFGGTDQILLATGLGYADYARKGFFELVWVAGLMLPLLVGANSVANVETERQRKALRLLLTGLASLLFIVIASAVYRMGMYVSAYGLSELRVSTSAFMLWLALVFAWFVAMLYTGKVKLFAPGALVSAVVVVTGLNFVNPDAMIARYNMTQLNENVRLDVAHLASLSADAVPTIVSNWEHVSSGQRQQLAQLLRSQWQEREADWRSKSISRELATTAVARLQ